MTDYEERFGPGLGANYRTPLFWLAAFDPQDAFVAEEKFDNMEGEECLESFTALWTSTSPGLERLRSRRALVLDVVGEAYSDIYDRWLKFLESSYPSGILLNPSDVAVMIGLSDHARHMTNVLQAFARGDVSDEQTKVAMSQLNATAIDPSDGRERSITEVVDYRWSALCGYRMTGRGAIEPWPPTPSDTEAATVWALKPSAAVLVRQARPEVASRPSAATVHQAKPWWKVW